MTLPVPVDVFYCDHMNFVSLTETSFLEGSYNQVDTSSVNFITLRVSRAYLHTMSSRR